MSAPRLVLDASVLLAALLTPNRRSASCLLVEAIGTGTVQLVVSAPVLAEYQRTVEEHGWESRLEDPLGLVLDLHAAAEWVEPAQVRVVKADPSDDVYLGTALAGRATFLATFDRRHLLPLDPWKGVRVLTPGDVLRGLRGLG